ncbi:MAG TPA: InlB B-repeat-containing protein [Mollicutes bacterium]|nr:InlB B-repeat-containing protein [Mollicutes bacterium]
MYQEQKVNFNWKGFLLKFLLLVIVLVLIFMLLPINRDNKNGEKSDLFTANVEAFKAAGDNYFIEDNLPKNEGGKYRVTLKDLVSIGGIKTLRSLEGNTCDEKASYIEVTKKENKYEAKLYLVCDDEEETLNYEIKTLVEEPTTTVTTTTTTKKVETTKKPTTTKVSVKPTSTTTKTVVKSTTTANKALVIFNSNGGSEVASQYITKGSIPSRPNNPVRSGYTFQGWYINGARYNFNVPLYGNTIILAKWEVNLHKNNNYISNLVTFDSNGGSYVANQKVISGGYVKEPSEPLRAGAKFLGWYHNNEKFNFNKRIYENITLKAKWLVKKTYLQDVYTMGYGTSSSFIHDHVLNVPSVLLNKYNSNIKLKSVEIKGHINSHSDLNRYYSLYTHTFAYNDQIPLFNYPLSGLDSMAYVVAYVAGGNEVRWSGIRNRNCRHFILANESVCGYGIYYEATWEYERVY